MSQSHMVHPRSIYFNNPPDFEKLALQFTDLQPFIIKRPQKRSTIDFQNPEALKQLTCALLKVDFNITLTLPKNALCPAVTNRLNYVLWIEDLVNPSLDKSVHIRGIDIGTGSSCIYPLLACTQNPNWEFLATDISTTSLEQAAINVNANHLINRICLWHSEDSSLLQSAMQWKTGNYDFCMCNPPFYSDTADIESSRRLRRHAPHSVCSGTQTEMTTEGGEETFIHRLIQESLQLKYRIRWFTTMLGKKSSLKTLLALLESYGITTYVTTEFRQGFTRRWGLGWSFDQQIPSNLVPKLQTPKLPTSLTFSFSSQISTAILDAAMTNFFESVSVPYHFEDDDICGMVSKDTWSRHAKRSADPVSKGDESEHEVLFSFTVSVANDTDNHVVEMSYVQEEKNEPVYDLFLSFYNTFKRRVVDNINELVSAHRQKKTKRSPV